MFITPPQLTSLPRRFLDFHVYNALLHYIFRLYVTNDMSGYACHQWYCNCVTIPSRQGLVL